MRNRKFSACDSIRNSGLGVRCYVIWLNRSLCFNVCYSQALPKQKRSNCLLTDHGGGPCPAEGTRKPLPRDTEVCVGLRQAEVKGRACSGQQGASGMGTSMALALLTLAYCPHSQCHWPRYTQRTTDERVSISATHGLKVGPRFSGLSRCSPRKTVLEGEKNPWEPEPRIHLVSQGHEERA